MSVQCLVDPDEAVELLPVVGLVDPDVPLVPVVPVVPVEVEPVLVLVVVAASATSAPPATRPLVSAPTAITFRRRNLMVAAPSVGVTHSPHSEEWGHLARRICGSVSTRITPR